MARDRFKSVVGPRNGDARILVMITQPYRIYIERSDRRKNMARFYALAIERTLFGEICLRRRWGRIGTHGQEMAHYFDGEMDAVSLFLDLTRAKRNRGYSPRKSLSDVRR